MTASYIEAIRATPDEHRSLNDQIILALVAEMDGLFEQYEGALATIETLESKEELSAIIRAQTEEIESLSEQLEAVRTWFRTEPWKGHPDGSSFGCGDYTQAERAMGYGSYRDPRFLPAFLREASTPASEPEEE